MILGWKDDTIEKSDYDARLTCKKLRVQDQAEIFLFQQRFYEKIEVEGLR